MMSPQDQFKRILDWQDKHELEDRAVDAKNTAIFASFDEKLDKHIELMKSNGQHLSFLVRDMNEMKKDLADMKPTMSRITREWVVSDANEKKYNKLADRIIKIAGVIGAIGIIIGTFWAAITHYKP